MGRNSQLRAHAGDLFYGSRSGTRLSLLLIAPFGIALSIIVAVLLNTKIRESTYRTLYFLPVVTMPVAVAMVWRCSITDFGLITTSCGAWALQAPLVDRSKYAMLSLIVVSVWSSIGYNMVIFSRACRASQAVLRVRGYRWCQRLCEVLRITLPLLTPTIFFVTVTSLISSFQVFELIFTMIINSPVIRHTQSIVFYFYRAFVNMDKENYAAAISLVLFVVILG